VIDERALVRLRAALVAALDAVDELEADALQQQSADVCQVDGADDDVMDVQTLAQRFNWPPDTVRHWLRSTPGLGERRGGRWVATAARFKAWLATRR
jgi:hypothetical protein